MVKPEKFGHLHLVYHLTVPLSHILGNNIAFVFIKDWKLKIFLKNSIFGPFRGHNVGPGWVTIDKIGYFHISHLTPSSVFPKKEVIKSHSLQTH